MQGKAPLLGQFCLIYSAFIIDICQVAWLDNRTHPPSCPRCFMLANIKSAALLGIDAYPVECEVDIASGLPTFQTVGLPDAAVKESKDRVKSAITNSQFHFPVQLITVNLAPADTKKEGPSFDLPMAVGILAASGKLPQVKAEGFWMVGELSLDGKIRPIRGALSIALAARDA